MNDVIYAIDYETFFDSDASGYTLKKMSNWQYCNDKRFDAYMVGIVGSDGFEFVGHPSKAPWRRLEGAIVVAHNAGFEWAVSIRLKQLGIIPWDITHAEVYDTADLAAYCGYPRKLEYASALMLKRKLNKATLTKIRGRHWNEITVDTQKQIADYCLDDCRSELQIWLDYKKQWPDWERELSAMTREMCWTGLPVDVEGSEIAVRYLETLLWHTRKLIPWAEDPDAPVMSLKKAAEESRKHGIEPPKSMAKDDEEFNNVWLPKYGAKFPWAKALGAYRSQNKLLESIRVMLARTDSDGIFRYGLKYGGAHTMRDSGDGGFNVQNPSRLSMFDQTTLPEATRKLLAKQKEFGPLLKNGVYLRALMIKAPPGKIVGVNDLSAIEPCVLNSLAGDEEMVKLLHEGMDPYEATARSSHDYTDPRPLKEVDPEYRKYMKVEVLGCGYGAGPAKVQIIARTQAGLEISLAEAEKIVRGFRKRPFIPGLWNHLENLMKVSAGDDFTVDLPSGRIMRYRDVRAFGSLSGVIVKYGNFMRLKWWGGSLTENVTQACARDVFMWHMLKLKKAGIPQLLRSHDEAATLFDQSDAKEGFAEMQKIMSTPPEWMPDLPVACDGGLFPTYRKP